MSRGGRKRRGGPATVRRWRRRGDAATGATDSMCLLPWLNLSVDVDGTTRPCCKFDHVDEVDGRPLANVRDTTLDAAWNSAGMVRLREQFLAGERPAPCANCWAEEAAGVVSFRRTFVADRELTTDVDVTDVRPARPRSLDLKLSNTCNLACRICGPVASSRWLNEELRATPERPAGSFVAYLSDNRRYLADPKVTARADDLETLRRWAPHIEQLELTGGEPMLSKENADVLELLVAHGDPSRIGLQITTNATVIDDRIARLFPRFRRVTISLSIDDIGPRLEYQRPPSVWAEVEQHLDRYVALTGPNCQVMLNATVSMFNIWDLPDYLLWWRARFPGGTPKFNLNFLHHPTEQCVQQLPDPLKAQVQQRWAAHEAWADPRTRPRLDEAVAFLGAGSADRGEWERFVSATDALDERRGHSFADVYPSFTAAILDAGLRAPGQAARTGADRS